MRRFLIRWLVASIALYAAVRLVGGIQYDGSWTTLAGMALVFGLVNAFIRPLMTFLSCPLIIFTLGVFVLVINGAMLLLAAWLAQLFGIGFSVNSFGAAFWGALVVSAVSFLLNLLIGDDRERPPRHAHKASRSGR